MNEDAAGPTLLAGLCSVTFRDLDPPAVIDLCVKAELTAIEWGADVHVPPDDPAGAADIGQRTRDAGIDVASYGSYLDAGESDATIADHLEPVLDTAVALGATNVRVWAGSALPPATATPADRHRVIANLVVITGAAAERGLSISLEYHGETLTETADSAIELLDAVHAPNLFTYWQPLDGRPVSGLLGELDVLATRLSHLHVFRWEDYLNRWPLADGADLWPAAFDRVAQLADHRTRYAFLEFVRHDRPGQLLADARTLHAWLDAITPAAPPPPPAPRSPA